MHIAPTAEADKLAYRIDIIRTQLAISKMHVHARILCIDVIIILACFA